MFLTSHRHKSKHTHTPADHDDNAGQHAGADVGDERTHMHTTNQLTNLPTYPINQPK